MTNEWWYFYPPSLFLACHTWEVVSGQFLSRQQSSVISRGHHWVTKVMILVKERLKLKARPGGWSIDTWWTRRKVGGRGSAVSGGGRGLQTAVLGKSGRVTSWQSTGRSAGGTARSGVKNSSTAEVNSLLECIRRVVSIGNDQWELMSELHSMHYAHCGQTVEFIKRKFSALASMAPGCGNPTMPPALALAKEIWDQCRCFWIFWGIQWWQRGWGGTGTQQSPSPLQEISVASMQQDVEAAVITQLEQGDENELNNQQQLVTAASKARTRQNIICSTIDTVTFSNNNAFAAFLQQK